MQARAAVMRQPHGRWSIETVTVAQPGPGEVRVRVVASGICQTDVHAREERKGATVSRTSGVPWRLWSTGYDREPNSIA